MEDKELVKYATATESRNKYKGENQDSGFAGRVVLADGEIAYIACVADGVGSSEENKARTASLLTIFAFQDALRTTTTSTFSTLNQIYSWADDWGSKLQEDVSRRARYGMSTFCAVLLVPNIEDKWSLVSFNVGDSSSFMVSQNAVVSLVPPAPKDYPNSDSSGALERAVGQDVPVGMHIFDISLRLIKSSEQSWFVVASDGVTKFLGGSLLKQLCSLYPFHLIPSVILEKTLDESKGPFFLFKGKFDNATVSVIGLNVPERGNSKLPAINDLTQSDKSHHKNIRRKALNVFLFIILLVLFAFIILLVGNLFNQNKTEVNKTLSEKKVVVEAPVDSQEKPDANKPATNLETKTSNNLNKQNQVNDNNTTVIKPKLDDISGNRLEGK